MRSMYEVFITYGGHENKSAIEGDFLIIVRNDIKDTLIRKWKPR